MSLEKWVITFELFVEREKAWNSGTDREVRHEVEKRLEAVFGEAPIGEGARVKLIYLDGIERGGGVR